MLKSPVTALSIGVAGAVLFASHDAHAQRRPMQEFTRQELLVSNLEVDSGVTLRTARRVADALASRLDDLVDDQEVHVVPRNQVRFQLTFASYNPDSAVSRDDLRALGQQLRVDELVVGTLGPTPNGMRLSARLILVRDERLVQPLPAVIGTDPDKMAAELAPSIVTLRRQMPHQRRCENHLREGRARQAVDAARAGIAVVPSGVFVRTCLVIALRHAGAPAALVLDEARAVLALDPGSAHAIEAAAVALDSLRRRDDAADMWLRLVATDSTNVELIGRVGWALAFGGNLHRAEPLIARASSAHPQNMNLLRQHWYIAFENRNWPAAVEAGDALLAKDALSAGDATFFLKLATAYRANDQPVKAVEIASRGVTLFPSNARLYALYTQFVRAEADSAIPRGLALFPASAELLAMNAQVLRLAGRIAESLESSRLAVAIDSTLPQGHLMVAHAEMELGRPDTALAWLRRGLSRGEDSTLVAQFALSRGNGIFRAASGTGSRDDLRLAMGFLAFADSVRPSDQTKFLLGAAAFSVAQSALTDAPAVAEKTQSCELARLGAETIRVARSNLEAGQDAARDAARQYLEYLGTLQPYVEQQLERFCDPDAPRGH